MRRVEVVVGMDATWKERPDKWAHASAAAGSMTGGPHVKKFSRNSNKPSI
jgi:hypothetical protein